MGRKEAVHPFLSLVTGGTAAAGPMISTVRLESASRHAVGQQHARRVNVKVNASTDVRNC